MSLCLCGQSGAFHVVATRVVWANPVQERAPRRSRYKSAIERLEDRALLTASWGSFGGNAQHTEVSQVAAQPVNQLLWSTSLDLAPWGAVHYGDPIFTPGNTVIVPVKVTYSGQVQGGNNFFLEGLDDVTGAVEWTSAVTGSITGATNASPIVITSPNNGLVSGETVSIGGVQGNTNANGTSTITTINANSFSLNGTTGNGAYSGGGLWAYNPTSTSYIDPKYSWTPPYQPVYDPVNDRVYFPGPGGTLDYISHPDSPGSSTPTVVQEAFYGTSSYTANKSAYNSSIFINTGLTVDTAGNVYFGFTETGSNPSGINDGGIARITPSGVGTYVLAATAVGQTNDGNWSPALGSSPALSNDGSTLYLGINDSGYNLSPSSAQYNSYLVAVNTATMTPQHAVHLLDPSSGLGAGMRSVSTASPMVAPDNTVFLGVFGNPYNGSRGFMLHFSGNLSTEYTPGAFGWDDTASIIPASMVPSYTGSSSYLILAKYNNYANAEVGEPYGGSGVNKIAILDPYASQLDPNYDPNPNLQVMKEIMTLASPSPDLDNQAAGDPDAVREWCTNGTVVDPANDSVFINNEDGYTYQWNLGTDEISNAVEVTSGVGVPYTPTAIGPNGEVFSDNGGTLFALGGYTNFSMSTVSSANPAVVGNSITFTTTMASTNSGPTPTGTVTFSYYQGANNLYNGNTTPVPIGTVNLINGVASISISSLVAAHYHVMASYSGDGTISAGQTILVQPVLETVTTTVTSSVNPVNAGTSVTLTASVAPNGTTFVPIGTVTFMDGSTVLGTVSLNNLENETNPPSTNTATFTTSSLPGGTDAITAVYGGDQNFTTGTSSIFDEYIPAVVNPGTENSAVGDTISLQVQASGLASGDSWTFSATGLPSGLSINPGTGQITGTITGSTTSYSASVTAADGTKASASQSFTWNVSTLSETNPGTQNSAVGDSVSLQIQDTGLPSGDSWSYSATGLPSGLSINPSSGLITGTITGSANTYSASVTASDGHGGSASQSFTWNVFSRPAISAPVSASVTENVWVTFSPANGNAITVTDLSAGGSPDSMTVSVSNGTVTLGTTAGLTFTGGANGSNSFTVSGTLGNLNAALNGLTYVPNPNYTGTDSLALSLTDPGDSLTSSASVALTVSAPTPPAITAPASATVSENGSLVFSSSNGNALSFTDNGAGLNADVLTMSVSHGTLTLGNITGLTFTAGGNGTASFTVNGGVSNLNAALASVTYQPTANYAGSDSLVISVTDPTDSKSGSTSVALTISALAPAITAPATGSLSENGSLVFSSGNGNAISVTDSGPGPDSLTLSVTHGKLTLSTTSGLTFTTGSNGSASFTVTGSVANFNAALSGLTYTPTSGYSGSDSLAVSLTDSGDSESASKSVALTINGLAPPSITAPATASVLQNGTLTFSSANGDAILVSDSAAGGGSDSLTLSVSHGKLTLSTTTGLTFTTGSNGTASFTVTGTVASLNAALSGLTYAPTAGYTGSDSLAISITDPGDSESASNSVALTVNAFNPPTITAPTAAAVVMNGTLAFTSPNVISVADSGPGSGSDALTLTVTHGTLTFASTTGLTFTSGTNGTASFTVTGSVANLNAALGGLTYKPTTGYTGSDSLAILIKDTSDNLSASATVALTVNSGSTGPSITAPATVNETTYAPIVFKTVSISDSSAGSGIQQLSLKSIAGTSGTVPSGTLSLATMSGITIVSGANNSASMVIDGTLAALNAALNGLSFTPTVKTSTITLAYTDLGNGQSATATITVNVSKLIAPPPGGGDVAISPDTESTAPVDSQTQWKGLAAAVELLVG